MIGLRVPATGEPEVVEELTWSSESILALLDRPPLYSWRDLHLPVGGGQARLFLGRGWTAARTPPGNAAATRLVGGGWAGEPAAGTALIVRSQRHGNRGARRLDTLSVEEVLALGVAIVLSEPGALPGART